MSLLPEIYIGIDPDVQASGFAVWDKKQLVTLDCLDLPDIFESLLQLHQSKRVMVRMEAGWKAKGMNWHHGGLGSANAVGRNHEIGRQIEKYCIKHGIPYCLIKPLGYSQWTHDRFCAYTGWKATVKTNAETRVAGMLVFGC